LGVAVAFGIDIRHGQVAATQQLSDLSGIDLVILRLAAVNGFHVQGMAKDEGGVFRLAEVDQPVPAEQALASDDQVVTVGGDRLQESRRVRRYFVVQDNLTGVVEDAQVHCPGVQIDPAVESVSVVVKAHHALLGMGPGA
jgi:hypothetical protein